MPVDRALILKKLDFLNKQLSGIERMEFDEESFTGEADIHWANRE